MTTTFSNYDHSKSVLWYVMYVARSGLSFCLLALTIIVVKLLSRIYSFIYNVKNRGFDVIEPNLFKLVSHLWNKDTFKILNELTHFLENSKHGITGWISPVGRPFMLVSNDVILKQVLVQHQDKILNTHYKLDIMEYLRKTKISIGPSWQTLHTTISKFSIFNNQDLLSQLNKIIADNTKTLIFTQEPPEDFSITMNQLNWQIATLLCFGIFDDTLCSLLGKTWDSLQIVINHPFSHIYENVFPHLPFSCVRNFKSDAANLRKYLLKFLKVNRFPEYSYISSLGQLSNSDKLEVAIEFLIILSSSTTSTLIWLIWHLSTDKNLANSIRREIASTIDLYEDSKTNSLALLINKSTAANSLNSISSSSNLLSSMSLLNSAYKETLRLYSPIQICRYTNQELPILINAERIFIPKGTNILCNNWFIHRNSTYWNDPHSFDHKRFMSKDKDSFHNFFHPFSLGIRVCPGQDIAGGVIKLTAIAILQQYKDFEPLSDKLSPKFKPQFAMPVNPCEVFLKFNGNGAPEGLNSTSTGSSSQLN